MGDAGYEVLHGLIRFYPGASASCPTRSGAQRNGYSESSCLFFRVCEHIDPLLTEEIDPATGHADVDFQEYEVADTRFFHRFQVRGDRGFVHITIHEVPVYARAG